MVAAASVTDILVFRASRLPVLVCSRSVFVHNLCDRRHTRPPLDTKIKQGTSNAANLRPQLQCPGSHEPGVDGADCDRIGGHARSTPTLTMGNAAGPAPRSAGSVQPQTSRAGTRPAMPVLSHHG